MHLAWWKPPMTGHVSSPGWQLPARTIWMRELAAHAQQHVIHAIHVPLPAIHAQLRATHAQQHVIHAIHVPLPAIHVRLRPVTHVRPRPVIHVIPVPGQIPAIRALVLIRAILVPRPAILAAAVTHAILVGLRATGMRRS